ncbi:amino acid transporter, putative [Plasmodium vinckei brucechwatti]|uniref:Amino acid transporter, putative n=1 Tax=Plasmodium vinckei brucechwatti TaxID=119398 RepID=A0A6V7S6I4_PLAVN|nr:amino acid transporter, putative [Plasmodium vinckei brucechwatti]
MHKKISQKENENGANEFSHEKKKKKKKMNKWSSPYAKGPNDLKSYLYGMCINFSYSDIYQEYISRLSLNSYNNCDYDQIRRSSYISKNDFLKYYNFLLYDNNFELEEENNGVDDFSFVFKKPNDSSDIEEVATYLIGKCDDDLKEDKEKYKESAYNKIKKLILNKYRNKNILLTMSTDDNSDITDKSKKKEIPTEQSGKKQKNITNNYNSKSYTLGKSNTHNIFYNSYELIKNEESNEKKSILKIIKKSFFLLRDFFTDKNEISFMSNLNIYFLNYENVSKNEIKTVHNNHYFYMLNNLSESQNDPSVEMYYNFYNNLVRDKNGSDKNGDDKNRGDKYGSDKNGSDKNGGSLKMGDEEMAGEVRIDRIKYDEHIYGATKPEKLMKYNTIPSKHTQINIRSASEHSNEKDYSIMSYEGKDEISMQNEKNGENEPNLEKTEYKGCRRRSIKRLCSEETEIYFKKVIKNEIINFNQKRIDNKDKWNTLFSFMFSCIGASLSTHCYLDLSEIKTNFDFFLLISLIIICYILIGLPLLQIEFSLGQISQSSVVNAFSFLKKKYTGIGIITLIITFNVLSKNIYRSVDTVVVITNSLKKPLPWQMNHCEKIQSEHMCIQNERCRWVAISSKLAVQKKIYKGIINLNAQNKIKKKYFIFPYLYAQNNSALLNSQQMECKSIGILEGINFFSKDICFCWKTIYLLSIMLVLYILLRIEEMSCNKFLQYSFLFFITNCIFQMIQMYSKICLHQNDGNNMKNNINPGDNDRSIFWGEENLLYINMDFIGKIINIVLISINCSTGINYMFSSYTNIGDNILLFSPYVILGSFVGVIIHFGYYYLCISVILKYGNIYDSIELNNLLMGLKMLPINYNSFGDLFKKDKKVIKNKIIYFIALSKMTLPNIMTFTYFLSSLLLLLISCSIHLKGILLILKERIQIRLLMKKLNNILYGKKRTYNLGGKKTMFLHPPFQKLNITWCLIVKYLIPFFLIFIFSSNSICNIHNIFISSKYHEKSKIQTFPKHGIKHPNTSNHLRINNNNLKTGENGNLNDFINKEDKYAKQNLMDKTNEKYKYNFGMLIQYIVSIILIIIICLFSVAPFINPKNLSTFVFPLTHIWNINDIQTKKKKPINYLYTRYIFFFEEILPCEKIMPFYVWKHIKKHIKKDSFITSLKRENENNPNINDKSFTNMNKDDYEKYIFGLIGATFKPL